MTLDERLKTAFRDERDAVDGRMRNGVAGSPAETEKRRRALLIAPSFAFAAVAVLVLAVLGATQLGNSSPTTDSVVTGIDLLDVVTPAPFADQPETGGESRTDTDDAAGDTGSEGTAVNAGEGDAGDGTGGSANPGQGPQGKASDSGDGPPATDDPALGGDPDPSGPSVGDPGPTATSATDDASGEPTPEATEEPIAVPTPEPTPTEFVLPPAATATPTAAVTTDPMPNPATPTPTPTASPTPTATPTAVPTPTATATATPAPTPTSTTTPTPTPTAQATRIIKLVPVYLFNTGPEPDIETVTVSIDGAAVGTLDALSEIEIAVSTSDVEAILQAPIPLSTCSWLGGITIVPSAGSAAVEMMKICP